MRRFSSLPSLIRDPLPEWLTRRTLTLAPGAAMAFDDEAWRSALVVVEEGELELETHAGERTRLQAGAVLSFQGLPLRAVRNPGGARAVVTGVRKRSPTR